MNERTYGVLIIKDIPRSYKGLKYGDIFGEVVTKQCSKCLEMKLIDEYNKRKTGFAGIRTYCKKCSAADFKQWRESNKDRERQRRRRYYRDNRDHLIRYSQKYAEENSLKVAENKRIYRGKELERHAEREAQRNEIKRLLPNTLSKRDKEGILERFNYTCALTGEQCDLEMDHAIPISVGYGGNIRGNVYPLASKLNRSKNSSNIFEWFDKNRKRFDLPKKMFDELIDYLSSENGLTAEGYREYVYNCHKNPRTLEDLRREINE